MAEAVVSIILEQLSSILLRQAEESINLVVGAKDEVEQLKSSLQAIKALLEDAESKQVKKQAVRDWLDKLKDVSYDIEDVVDEWNLAIQKRIKEVQNASEPLRKVSSLVSHYLCCCRQVIFRHDIALRIKKLNSKLNEISKEKDKYNLISLTEGTKKLERPTTTSMIDMSTIFGRDDDKKRLMNLLMSESSQGPNPSIISLVGIGGIGKTTLAQLVFNDNEVKVHFDIKMWVCVSDPFDEIRIAKAILESLTGVAPNAHELETVLQRISQLIERKRFLLVLDDVWIDKSNGYRKWEQLESAFICCAPGSRIVVTTRKEITAQVIRSTNVISLENLSDTACWLLFSKVALSKRSNDEREKLEAIGRKIVEKCDGLPLAIKTLASLLSLKAKVEQWQSVLDSELWEVKRTEFFPPLLFSYFDLPSALRRCFLYCAIFPKDFEIKKDKLIKLWMAQDYLRIEGRDDMELVGEEYFEYLAMCSFFQDFNKDDNGSVISCKMHDIVHDFAQFLSKNECFYINSNDPREADRKARHLMVENVESIPSFVYDEIKLRSLVFKVADFTVRVDFSKLFNKLTYLRTLDMNHRVIVFCLDGNRFLKGINKLVHLRYVKLVDLEKLPEALCDLWNLQTLILSHCFNLKRLPKRIVELINLRHLIIKGGFYLKYMPKGMERLTCLRTLSGFDVSSNKKASSITCLSELKHLQGDLFLSKLGRMRDIVGGELLKSKTKLLCLELLFDDEAVDEHEAVLEFLQPPPSLEKLELSNYQGITISPSWMPSLRKLRALSLSSCSKCERLPCSFAKLPSLESLKLSSMESIKRVGNEFLGILEEASLSSSSSSSSSLSTIIAFPKLKSLQFDFMGEWEEWSCTNTGENDIKIMPCLLHFEIRYCEKLKELPDYILRSTSLKMLEIWECRKLEDLFRSVKAEDWPNISPIPNILF